MRGRLVLVACLAIVVGLAATVVLAFAIGGSGGSAVSPGTSAAVAAFARRQVALVPAPSKASDRLASFRDASNGDLYTTDERGVLRGFIDRGAQAARAQSGGLSDEQLVAKARAFAEARFPDADVASMTATVKRRVAGMDEKGTKDWDVKVDLRQLLNGVPTFNHFTLSVDPATGQVVAMTRDEGLVLVSTKANITDSRARAVVAEAAAMPVYATDSCALAIIRDPVAGKARLVWQVQIHTGDESFGATAWGTVDAQSGTILHLAQS